MASIFGNAPDPTIVPLDPGTQGLLNAGVDRALQPDSQFAANRNAGAETAASNMGQAPEQLAQQNRRLGMDDGYNQALSDAYRTRSNESVGRLIRANEYKAKLQKADQMRQMSQAALAQQRVATQNYATLTEAYNQSEMARAEFVSQLFQTGGQMMAIGAARQRYANKTAAPEMPTTQIASADSFEMPQMGSSGANPRVGGYGVGGGGYNY